MNVTVLAVLNNRHAVYGNQFLNILYCSEVVPVFN